MFLRVVTGCYVALRLVLTWGLLRRQHTSSARPRVSVIVASKDEARDLPRLLMALARQTYENFEIVVVNDRSADATEEILQSWRAREPRLHVVHIREDPPRRSPKMHVLARGIEASDGQLLLLTDADCSVPPGWIEGIVAHFAADVGAVIGYVALDARAGSAFERIQAFDYFSMMALNAGAAKLGLPLGASGANLAYGRSAYDEAGGFDALPPDAIADDMALLYQVQVCTTRRIAFCDDPRTFVHTGAEPTLRRFFDQRARWFAGGQDVLGKNIPLLVTSSLIGVTNGILLGSPLFLLRRRLRRLLMEHLVARCAADLVHLLVGAQRFGKLRQIAWYPLWLPFHIITSNALPLYSAVARWEWH